MKRFLKVGLYFVLGLVVIVGIFLLDYYHLIPKRSYSNADFQIETYQSARDQDRDGIDDQTDLLQGAREYVLTRPKYKSKYYASGYPDDEYGVCTDVVAFALLSAGYDLRELLNQDVKMNPDAYAIETVDKNIDFRRVQNLKVYLEHNAICLTNDINEIEEWQGGDIVVFPKHIAIVSDKRNKKGVNYLIHNAGQIVYEEDALERYEVVGHYRIS